MKRNSASGNTGEQQLNSPKGHARSLYPTGDRLGRKFVFRAPLTQLSARPYNGPASTCGTRPVLDPAQALPDGAHNGLRSLFARTKPPTLTRRSCSLAAAVPTAASIRLLRGPRHGSSSSLPGVSAGASCLQGPQGISCKAGARETGVPEPWNSHLHNKGLLRDDLSLRRNHEHGKLCGHRSLP